ncbi:Vgb family protein [Streptomyces sp. NPDC054840]
MYFSSDSPPLPVRQEDPDYGYTPVPWTLTPVPLVDFPYPQTLPDRELVKAVHEYVEATGDGSDVITRVAGIKFGGWPTWHLTDPYDILCLTCGAPCRLTLNQANAIGRITVSGEVWIHRLPTPGACPAGLAASPDGSLWFTEIGVGRIGRLTTGTAAADTGEAERTACVAEFQLPDPDSRPHAVAVAPDGTCWFTEWATGRIGSVTPEGRITEHPLADSASEPHGLAFGPDGTLYVAEERGVVSRWDVTGTAGPRRP